MERLRAYAGRLSRRPSVAFAIAIVREWSAEDASMIAAAMAYYALVSLAPITVLLVSLAGLFFERGAVRETLLGLAVDVLDPNALPAVRALLEGAAVNRPGGLAALVALGVAIAGAVGVFAQLQRALNRIWDAPEPPHEGILGVLKRRLASFLMVLAVGLLLGLAVLSNTVLSGLGRFLPEATVVPVTLLVAARVVSFLLFAATFAVVYRVLPDVEISWRDVLLGSLVTAALFTAANLAVGMYFARSSVGSVYGTGGSVVVLLVWMYLIGQAVLLGAVFTHKWACTHGSLRDVGTGPARSCLEE